jgi:hypothetical protein
MTDTATMPATAAPAVNLGDQVRLDVVTGATAVVGDAVSALDQWLETHIHNSPIGQNPALLNLVGSAFTALRSLLV